MNSFNQAQKPTECHVSFTLLAYSQIVQIFHARIHLKLYRLFMLFPEYVMLFFLCYEREKQN